MKSGIRTAWRFFGVSICVGVLAFIATAFWFVVSHRTSTGASAQLADVEFARLRARFAGQQPLLDMQRREVSAAPAPPAGPARLHSFHTVIFDTRGRQRLVRIDVPYWFGRRFARHDGEFTWLGELTFLDDTEFDPEAIRLSVDQIERRGPGLVADY